MKQSYCTIAAALLLASAASAAPGDVNADTFYKNALALQKKGKGAIFDGRLKPMMAQMKDAGARVSAENKAARASGKPLYCPPQDKKGLGPQEIVAMIGRVPENERRAIALHEAWRRALMRDYPCR